MKVVVTGAAGLLGRHVARAYHDAGHEVVGLDAHDQGAVAWASFTADLSDLALTTQLFEGADAIAHCAAIPRPTGRAAAEIYRVNMATAYAAVEATRLVGAKRFIQASSFSVMGYPFARPLPKPQSLPITEAQSPAPQDIYGTTKWLAEELIEAQVRAGSFSAVSLRMPWIQTAESFYAQIGPRRQTAAAAEDLWSYLDARDAGRAFVQALEWSGNGHLRCYLSAADSYSEIESQTLIAAAFGEELAATSALSGHQSLISSDLAAAELGFKAQHSWRDYPISRTE